MTANEWQNDERGALASRRYRDLVVQLGEELHSRYGWKAAVARRLGVHPSYISKVVAGEVAVVGAPIIDRAAASIGIRHEYFIDPADRSYREFLAPEGPGARPLPEDWKTGRRLAERMWRLLAIRASAIREADIDAPEETKLRKARDMAQAVLASKLVQSAQAIAATDDPAVAWPHAIRIAAQAEAEEEVLHTLRRLEEMLGKHRG